MNALSPASERYFAGSANSDDYLIDIWTDLNDIDPFSYPADVQAYLECVSRWSRREPIGYDHQDELKALGDQGPPSYRPDAQRILDGISVLKRECTGSNAGRTLYFPRGHEFPRAALAEYPHYPWLFGLDMKGRSEMSEYTGSVTRESPEYDDSFLIIGNARIGLPPGLAGPHKNPLWVAMIGEVYGGHHPSNVGTYGNRKTMLTDAQISLEIAYGVAAMGGREAPFPLDVDPEPMDDDVRRGITDRSGWDGWVEL